MERKKRVFSCVLVIIGIMVMISNFLCENKKEREEYSGIPDVVNSTISDSDYDLTVVANRNRIENEEEFAREIIRMCQENSFHSTKLSTDINYPTSLNITVFLSNEDIEKRNAPIFIIEFKPDDFNEGWNIKDDLDKFHLYVNGKQID